MPQLSTQLTGSAQLVAQEVSAFPHWSTQAPECWQDPTTQATQAPLLSHTSPRGQGQVMLPQPSLHRALSGHDGTHVSVFGAGPHPSRAKAPARATMPDRVFAVTPRTSACLQDGRSHEEHKNRGWSAQVAKLTGICHRIRLAARVGVGEAWRNMLLGRHAWLAVLSLWLLACTNTPNTPADASRPVDRPVDCPAVTDGSGRPDVAPDAAGFQCGWPAALDNGALNGCGPARAFVTCSLPGTSASYATTEHGACVSCSGTCLDSCALGEFALSCAASLPDTADAAVSSGPAHGCRFAAAFPLGSVVYCCPCQ